jgi:AraC-like DNA-binding protein
MTVAALLDSQAALSALRRTLPAEYGPVRGCRTDAALERVIVTQLVDSMVVGTRSHRSPAMVSIRSRFPAIPVVVYGTVKPDHGAQLLDLDGGRVQALLVEGIDDAVAGEVVARSGWLATRRQTLADVPRLLRLTEPLQRRAFDVLLSHAGGAAPTAAVAQRLRVSREHLSRQFGAGGAPNLKRVIDLLQVLAARDLVANPGFRLATVTTLLGWSNPRHLAVVVKRIFRLSLRDWRTATSPELIRRFLSGGGRSRP